MRRLDKDMNLHEMINNITNDPYMKEVLINNIDHERLNIGLLTLDYYEIVDDNLSYFYFFACEEDIKELMMSHKLYVLSSKFEGFGMVLIEAMAMGCPCVSYDLIAGPNEIIKNGEDGLLVENQNIDKLAEAMDYMLSHEEERKEMAKNAMVNVKRFEVEKIVDKWEEMFFDLKTR